MSCIAALRGALQSALIERDAESETLLIALVAGESVLFVGPPGTAKTYLAESLGAALGGQAEGAYAHALLTKHSSPEEIFGPLDPSALISGRYERLPQGYLPSAFIAFIDEVGRASSAIAGALLTLLNERAYRHGGGWRKASIRLIVGASNSWPIGPEYEEFGALYDRFVFRRAVRRVSGAGRRELFGAASRKRIERVATCAEVEQASAEASALPIAPETEDCLEVILSELEGAGIQPSDRRIAKCLPIARAAAYCAGATEVLPEHLECLADVLWDCPETQAGPAARIVAQKANPHGATIADVLRVASDVLADLAKSKPEEKTGKRLAATAKLDELRNSLAALSSAGSERAKAARKWMREQHESIQRAIASGSRD